MDISKMSEKEIMNCLNNCVPPIYELIMDLSREQQTDAVIRRAVEIQPSNLGDIKKTGTARRGQPIDNVWIKSFIWLFF